MKCNYCKQVMGHQHSCEIQNKAVLKLIEKGTTSYRNKANSSLPGAHHAQVEVRKNYNGSGYAYFNKAREWVRIDAGLSLPTNVTAVKVEEIRKDLIAVFNKHGFK